jgi:hypothetical protein
MFKTRVAEVCKTYFVLNSPLSASLADFDINKYEGVNVLELVRYAILAPDSPHYWMFSADMVSSVLIIWLIHHILKSTPSHRLGHAVG